MDMISLTMGLACASCEQVSDIYSGATGTSAPGESNGEDEPPYVAQTRTTWCKIDFASPSNMLTLRWASARVTLHTQFAGYCAKASCLGFRA